ncbi:hypothetical protein [uncultured Microbulbifer sp.]|uniref:phthiocerol/phthiodiolone dimycocerosyl transferase family protein n=1 Tax=uncultured Microbulbifer sp. TaxID=348147 RepID=UPI002630E341|nr:hypothetical protein [uncultured Microbulbifer sp.]
MQYKPFSRPLGYQEALFTELTRWSCGGVQLLSFVRICEPLKVEVLQRAFALLHGMHPMLQARVVRGDSLFWRCDVDFASVPFEVQVLKKPFNFGKEYSLLGNKKIQVDKYSYRVRLFSNSDGLVEWAAVLTNHAAIDGRSIMTMFCYLDFFIQDGFKTKLNPLPMYSGVTDHLKAAGQIGREVLLYHKQGLTLWPVESPAPASKRRSQATYRERSPALLQSLSLYGKAHEINLSALLCAVAVKASRVLPVYHPWVEVVFPVDARKLCQPKVGLDTVGCFSAVMTLELAPEILQVDLIVLAKWIQQQLNKRVMERESHAFDLKIDYKLQTITDMAKEYAKKKAYFPSGICVSNVGSMRTLASDLKYFEIEAGMLIQNHGTHPIMVITYSTTRRSVFVFGYCEPLMSKKSALLYVERYMDLLKSLLGDVS